jgi:hypothetical protein
MEDTYTAADVIDFTLDGNMNSLQAAVDNIMKERVAELLAAKKIEVSKNLFNQEV